MSIELWIVAQMTFVVVSLWIVFTVMRQNPFKKRITPNQKALRNLFWILVFLMWKTINTRDLDDILLMTFFYIIISIAVYLVSLVLFIGIGKYKARR